MAMFSRWMVGAVAVLLTDLGDGGHAVAIKRDGQRIYIAWNQSKTQTLRVPSDWDVSQYQYLGGAPQAIPVSREVQIGPTLLLMSLRS